MKNHFVRLHTALKNWVENILMKRILIPGVLLLIYFTAVAATSLVARIFFRKYLTHRSSKPDSNWRDAEGFEIDFTNGRTQS